MIVRTARSEDEVRRTLPNLEVTLSAHATEAVPQGSGNAASASGKHDLITNVISASESAQVATIDDATYIVMNCVLELPWPRARLQRPALYFTAYLAPSAEALVSSKSDGKVYLQSLEPLPANVLEPLQFMSPSNTGIYLSESKITKLASSTARTNDLVKPLRAASKRAFPIVPALLARTRYSVLQDSVVASLHLETSRVVSGKVSVKDVRLVSLDVQIEALNSPEWPLESSAGNETTLLFKITKARSNTTGSPANLSIQVDAAVEQNEGSSIELLLQWQAQVDITLKSTAPTYKWSRPMSTSNIRPTPRPSIHGDSKATPSNASQQASPEQTGVIFNISTVSIIPPKINFKLYIQCINHSDRPRRFAIIVLEPKKRSMKLKTESNSGRLDFATSMSNTPLQTQRPPHVFDLNPDVRIGPIPPGACYETELKFWAATTGVLDLGVLRIVDLDTRQTVDVRELPDVVVLDPSAE